MTQSLLDGFCVKPEKQNTNLPEPAGDKMEESDSDTEEKLVIVESDTEKTTPPDTKSTKYSKSRDKNKFDDVVKKVNSSAIISPLKTPSSTKKRKKVVDLFGDSSEDEFEIKKIKQSKANHVEKDKEQNDNSSSSSIVVSSELTILKRNEKSIPKVNTITKVNKTSAENNKPQIASESSNPSNKAIEIVSNKPKIDREASNTSNKGMGIINKPKIAPEPNDTSNKAMNINNKPKVPPEPSNSSSKTKVMVNKEPTKDHNSSKDKVKVDIAEFVVKQMTPYYKKGMIASRELFKATARHIVHHLLSVNKTGKCLFKSFTN